MSKLYVLQLEGGKYYVGKTDNLEKRFSEHKTGRGSEWTKLHKPVKILETRNMYSNEDENNVTKELMKKYGYDNVRGGSFVQKEIPDYVKKTLQLEERGNTDTCFKCGKSGHFARDCEEEEDEEYEDVWACDYCQREFDTQFGATVHERSCKFKNGTKTKLAENSKSSGVCYRCGRPGHYSPDCYARWHADGYEID